MQQVYGIDLATEWRARRWRKLLILIEQLPPASRFTQAMLTDPARAESLALAQLEAQEKEEQPRPSFTEWSLTNSLLTRIANQLSNLSATAIAIGGGNPPDFPPALAPVSLAAAAIEQASEEATEDLVSLLCPHARKD